MRPRQAALLSAMILSLSTLAAAQSPPNFSGTWVLQVAESDFGMLGGPESRIDRITHTGPNLVIQRTVVAQGQETAVELRFAIDGAEHRNLSGGSELISTLRWDGEALLVLSRAQSPQGEALLEDRYTLSQDRTVLTQARTITVGGQSLAQRIILRRE